MLRLVAYLIPVGIVAWALSWLADRPGSLVINWQGREIETSVFHAVVILALLLGLSILAWSVIVQLWRSPAILGAIFNRRRQVRGLDAISSGMIAIGAGDRAQATRYAVQARKALPNEPLTHLLRAQAAQLAGDRVTARHIFESMLGATETEQLGLRGLFLEAEREGEHEAARQFAERAVRLNPKLGWPVDALFDLQCKDRDWDAALDTLAIARRNQQIEKSVADRRRAVLLTARAQALEDASPDQAMQLALKAHHLAHDLIPAAAIAGRILAARGHTKRAAHVIERAWRRAPHPDLATVYAHARVGDSPRDRLDRIKRLGPLNQHSIETPIAIATAAIDARNWEVARSHLASIEEDHASQRVCMLMARIEGEQHGDTGRVREWLARAVHAPRDPVWVADGVMSDRWAPVSPVTGELDAFQWRVPVSTLEKTDTAALARKLDDLVRLGAERSIAESASSAPAVEIDAPSSERPAATVVKPAPASTKPQPSPATPSDARLSATVSDLAASTRVKSSAETAVATEASPPDTNRKPLKVEAAAPTQQPHRDETGANGRAEPAKLDRAADYNGALNVAIAEFGGGDYPDRVKSARATAGRNGADRGSAVSTAKSGKAAERPINVFVPPRAPDDPGPDVTTDSGAGVVEAPVASKRSL